jgi:hypothetical protein
MKQKIIFFCIVVIIIVGFIGVYVVFHDITKVKNQLMTIQNSQHVAQISIDTVIPTPKSYPTILFRKTSLSYALHELQQTTNIDLIPNFIEKITSSTAKENNACLILTSAGFYTTDNTPIGLFSVEHEVMGKNTNSPLFNGYVYSKDNTSIELSSEPPSFKTAFAFQTGPILYYNSTKRLLKINNDEEARRIILFSTKDYKTILLVLFQKENTFKGPLLGDTPEILSKIVEIEKLTVTSAINLDGGSHSAFISSNISLGELLPVGSFLCVK